MKPFYHYLPLLVIPLLIAGGCSPRSQTETAATPEPTQAPKPPMSSTEEVWTSEQIAFIRENFGALESTSSGIYYRVLAPGQGEDRPAKANLCTVKYKGTFLDGRVFDESARHGGPFKFRVGLRQVIRGWDDTVLEMRRGEKRMVVLPYWLAYGKQGMIPVIPPRTPLVFEIELLGWESTEKVPSTQ